QAVTTDVDEFDRLLGDAKPALNPDLRREKLARAVALYKGELLPGRYEYWAVQEQDRCKAAYIEALRTAPPLAEGPGALEAALRMAGQVARLEPLDEEACRAQMRLCLSLGRAGFALECYQSF